MTVNALNVNSKGSNLHLNVGDYWECPQCRLQLQIVTEDDIKIVDERGNGKLRHHVYNPEISGEKILVSSFLATKKNTVIKNITELKEHLKQVKTNH